MNFCCLVFCGNMPLSQVGILWKICPTVQKGTDLYFILPGSPLPSKFDTMINFCFNFVNEPI
jgi:hypothetical protein